MLPIIAFPCNLKNVRLVRVKYLIRNSPNFHVSKGSAPSSHGEHGRFLDTAIKHSALDVCSKFTLIWARVLQEEGEIDYSLVQVADSF